MSDPDQALRGLSEEYQKLQEGIYIFMKLDFETLRFAISLGLMDDRK